MDVWFLTMVINGHVSLTSIMSHSISDANEQAYREFTRILGTPGAWAMSEKMTDVSPNLTTWELENYEGTTIKATLIKA